MCNFLLQVGGEIDNGDCSERTLLDTNTTTNAQILRNESNLVGGFNLDTELTSSDYWA